MVHHHRVVKLLEQLQGLLVHKKRQYFIMMILEYPFTMMEAMVAGKHTIVHKCDGLLREFNFIHHIPYGAKPWQG